MVRNKSQIGTNSGKSPAKKSRKSDSNNSSDISSENDISTTLDSRTTTINSTTTTVHKQNLYIVSFPIVFLFNILRSILYQLFLIFKYIFTTSSRLIYRPYRRKDCNIEVIVNPDDCRGCNTNSISDSEIVEMSVIRPNGPGPGDPLLAKQKHHHRRAFEYISKALKIDEENEGKL